MLKKSIFLNRLFFKLETCMIAQNDHNKIVSHFYFIYFFPGGLKKLKKGQKPDF